MVATDGSPEKSNEKEVGTMEFTAKVEPESVNLVCRTRMNSPDGKEFVDFQLSCHCSADGRLRLQRFTSDIERSDGLVLQRGTGTVEGAQLKFSVLSGGQSRTLEETIPEGAIIDLAFFFIVPQLPRETGRSWVFEAVLPSPTNVLRKPAKRTITCLGIDDSVSTGERKLFKFTNVAEGQSDESSYWVDERGVLQRVQVNPRNRIELIE